MADAVQSQNPSRRNALTQKRLHEVLDYDPLTGIFRWRVQAKSDIPPGSVAGGKRKRGYIAIGIDQRRYSAHRLAWLYIHGNMPNSLIDHINGVVDDNRIDNLRLASATENARNRCGHARISGLPKGVYRKAKGKTFFSMIRCDGVNYYLGRFATSQSAHEAYCKKASELFGEYARDFSAAK